ncbi:MAG: hypothetical protein Q9186_003625 [Xanthomendoza sp. 1 TL-2023]
MPTTSNRWTPEEDEVLRQEVESHMTEHGEVHQWNDIAKRLPKRSNKDCRKRFYNEVKGQLKKVKETMCGTLEIFMQGQRLDATTQGPWTPEEDEKLATLVKDHGLSWAAVSHEMETRNADRKSHIPDNRMINTLLLATQKHGSLWKDIQNNYFPRRSSNNVKNQYSVLQRRDYKLPSSSSPSDKGKRKKDPDSPGGDANASSRHRSDAHRRSSNKGTNDDLNVLPSPKQAENSEAPNYGVSLQDFPDEGGHFAGLLDDEPLALGGKDQRETQSAQTGSVCSGMYETSPVTSNFFADFDFPSFGSTPFDGKILDHAAGQSFPSGRTIPEPENAMSLGTSPMLDLQAPARTKTANSWHTFDDGDEASYHGTRGLTITVDDANGADVTSIINAVLQTKARVTLQRK